MPQGNKVLLMEGTACQAGDSTIVTNFDYSFVPGERIDMDLSGASNSSFLIR